MKNINDVIFVVVTCFVIGFFAYRIIRNGGLKGALFGLPIIRTVGKVEGEKRQIVTTQLNVHLLGEDANPKKIGIEIVAKSFASYQMLPIVLDQTQANQLLQVLQQAIEDCTGG